MAAQSHTGALAGNHAVMLNALAQINEMPDGPGLFTEALAQALTLTTDDAKSGIEAFPQKRDIRF